MSDSNELYMMNVDMPKAAEDVLRVMKTIRRAYNAFNIGNEITSAEARDLAVDVTREGPKLLASGDEARLEQVRDAMREDAPEVFTQINPSADDIVAAMPTQVLVLDAEDSDDESEEATALHKGALVALALMGAVDGDAVQAVGLAACLGGITSHPSFVEAVSLLSETYQIQVVSEPGA